MAYNPAAYTCDGVETDYDVPFAYVSRAHVKAAVDLSPVTFTWLTPSRIQLDSPGANGAALSIFRETSIDAPAVVYQPTQTPYSSLLNTTAAQILFALQEEAEAAARCSDLTTQAFNSAVSAALYAQSSTDSASAAASSASAASTSATNAASSASAASTSATNAATSATAASGSASAAASSASAASTSASAASTSATAAAGSASAASTSATNASTSATAAAASAAIAQANTPPVRVATIASLRLQTWTGGNIPDGVITTNDYFTTDPGGNWRKKSTGATVGEGNGDDDGVMNIVTASGVKYERVYTGFIDGRFAGMRGNGATDNATAFARLLAWARTANDKGLTIYLPAGQYAFASTIELDAPVGVPMTSNIRFVGDGAWHTDDGTWFQFLGTVTASTRLLRMRSGVHISFEHIRFHAGATVSGLSCLVQIDSMGDSGTYYSSFNDAFKFCRFTATNGTTNALVQLSNCANITFDHCDFAPTVSTVALRLGTKAGTSTLTAVTKANPGVFTTSGNHNLRVGDEVTLASVGGMTQLNGNVYYVSTTPTATTFTLESAAGVPLDTSGFSTYTSGGTVQIYRNVSSFGGGIVSAITLRDCLFRGDVEHCRLNTVLYDQCTFSTTGTGPRPTRITSVGDGVDEGTTFRHCYADYGTGALGAFYTQGALGKGLLVDGGRFGADHTKGFDLSGGLGFAHIRGVNFSSSYASGFRGVHIGASTQGVRVDTATCWNSDSGVIVYDARSIYSTDTDAQPLYTKHVASDVTVNTGAGYVDIMNFSWTPKGGELTIDAVLYAVMGAGAGAIEARLLFTGLTPRAYARVNLLASAEGTIQFHEKINWPNAPSAQTVQLQVRNNSANNITIKADGASTPGRLQLMDAW